MAYEMEDIRLAQKIFYYLLQKHELSEEQEPFLFKCYSENEQVMNIVKSQADEAECNVERYGSIVYIIPKEDNTYLGFSKAKLKEMLCNSKATDKDFYLSQFVILTLLSEFYDGQGSSAKARNYIRLGELQNCISDRLKEGAANTTEEDEDRQGIAFRNMLEAYEALRSDDTGKRYKTTKEGFLQEIMSFLEKQGLVEYVRADETITTTKKLDDLMEWNILNQNNYHRVLKVLEANKNSVGVKNE